MIRARAFALVPALLLPVAECAPPPPAAYEQIEITYRLAPGPVLTETRSGTIRLFDTPALPAVRGVLVPLLNASARASLLSFAILRAGGGTVAVQPGRPRSSQTDLFWDVPDAQAGDAIRFSVEQRVDLEGSPPGAWWFSGPVTIPLPFHQASVTLQSFPGFAGVETVLEPKNHTAAGETHRWQLDDSSVPSEASYFTISSFRSQEELGIWIAASCSIEPGPLVREFVRGVRALTPKPGARARALSDALSLRLRTRTSGETIAPDPCRPPDAVLQSRAASPLEAQALLNAIFLASGVVAGRGLSCHGIPGGGGVNPRAFTRAWVRVKSGDDWLWFDSSRLAGASGFPSEPDLAQPVLLIDSGRWTDLTEHLPPFPHSRLSAVLDATIRDNGALQGSVSVTAAGPPSRKYRDAFQPVSRSVEKLWGSFLDERRLASGAIASDPYDLAKPFEVELSVREPRFTLPIQRRMSLELNLLPLVQDPKPLPGNRWWIGAAGTYAEEITLDAPAFTFVADSHVLEKRGSASFRADAVNENGKLRITRELQITHPVVDGAEKREIDALWRLVRVDQKRSFLFRRAGREGVQKWIESVPGYEAQDLGLIALEQKDYDAARQLFERATLDDPKDEYAWNNLGQALLRLDRLAEARQAFEKQIEINPNDTYSYNNLGLVDLKEGRWEEARKHFAKQLELNPGDRYALINLPRALDALGLWAEAETAWTKVAQAIPGNRYSLAEVAAARICQDKVADASGELSGILGLSPGPLLLNNVAFILAECGKEMKLAEDYTQRATEQAHDLLLQGFDRAGAAFTYQHLLAISLDTLGWVLWKKGESESAMRALTASSLLAPSGEALAHLAAVEWRLGRSAAAFSAWREALLLMPGLASKVPGGLEKQVHAAPLQTVDGIWYSVPAGTLRLDSTEPSFFLAFANPDGTVRREVALDPGGRTPSQLVGFVHKLELPQVVTARGAIPTVHVLKIERDANGLAVAYRSTAISVIALASEMAPEEFPATAPPAQPQKKEQ